MCDWIAEIDRIEAEMTASGVPAPEAMRVSALFADALARADKAKRDAAAMRSKCSVTAKMCREIGTTQAAQELGIAPRTARWRRGRWLKVGNATP